MLSFPNCKINIGLRILQKRSDGFHTIESILYPLPFKESLEIVETKTTLNFSNTGIKLPAPSSSNLCVKAYQLLQKDFPKISAVKMHLHKIIPIGAGLGGGSADAAFILMMLNKQFNLKITGSQLKIYASQLGSDCPFFIENKPCFATEKGDVLENLPIDLSNYKVLLIYPNIHINTANAYRLAKCTLPTTSLKTLIQQPLKTWKKEIINDFEIPIFTLHPELREIKKKLYKMGALYAAMSGSGSTLYGLFEKNHPLKTNFPVHYFMKEFSLKDSMDTEI